MLFRSPERVVTKLYSVAQETMKNAEVMKRMYDGGVSIITSKSSAEFATFWKAEHERFAKVIRDAKIPTE